MHIHSSRSDVVAMLCVFAFIGSGGEIAFADAPTLTHRWSFNGDWSDSVGRADAAGVGDRVSLYGGKVHLGGNSYADLGHVNLGTNMLDTAAATIEIWARHDGVRKWSRVFDYGADTTHYFQMPWTNGTSLDKDSIGAKNGGGETQAVDTMAPYELGTDYHIAATFERQDDATVVRWQRRDAATGELQKSGTLTMSNGIHTIVDPVLYLGHSQYTADRDRDALAAYDEVRLWSGVLTDEQLAASAAAGPDATIAVVDDALQFTAGEPVEPPAQKAAVPDGGFRLMTYNVQFCYDENNTIIPDRTTARILAENPDFCCVNEVRDTEGHPEATLLAKLTGMHKSFYGNLLLSKEVPLSTEEVFLKMSDQGWGDRYCLVCEFTNFCVAVTHLDTPSKSGSEAAAEVQASNAVAIATIRAAFEKYTKPVFLCGDWNTRPNWENMERFNEFLEILSPTNGVRTYHGHDAAGGYVLDYISVDKAHKDDIYVQRSCVIEDTVTSDHNPVIAEIYLRPAASDLGWVDESFLSTGRTGTWSPVLAWDDATWKATLAGEKTFTALAASGGTPVTIEVTASFDSVPSKEVTPPEGTQGALGLGTNGVFQVWTSGGWVDVAADGVTPQAGIDYTFRFVFDYAAKTYSVSAGGAQFRATGDARTSFPLAATGTAISAVAFKGSGLLTSIVGEYVAVEGFAEDDELVLDNASVILDAAKAAWLNRCAGGKAALVAAAGNLSRDDFDAAYLLNLDITGENAYSFRLTSIEVDAAAKKVTIGVTLKRTGEIASAINGVLKFYGAATLAQFTDPALEPLGDATLSDDDFSEGGAATAEIPLSGDTPPVFFKAKIEER